MRLRFDRLFTGSQWVTDWLLVIDDAGVITESRRATPDAVYDVHVEGAAIPGFVNVHSHAFQRTMAGLCEYRTDHDDSFWTWRHRMYELVERVTPEDQFAIARQLYREMLRAGYTAVAEFHYVHRQPNGEFYDDPLAMSSSLVRAAEEVGIQLCLLPVLYQHAGFESPPLTAAQRRFVLTDDEYLQWVDLCHQRWAGHAGMTIGLAAHSLRAVRPETLTDLFSVLAKKYPNAPMHIHVAEQLREVEECWRRYGQRPVELLLERCPVDGHWCLIHATHLAEHELAGIAERGAVVGLCPTTEANLGDGFFATREFLLAGGQFGIGSDSQIAVDPLSELRWLEYQQRLTRHARNVLCDATRSVGRTLCDMAWQGGRQALRLAIGQLHVGDSADFLCLDMNHPSLVARKDDQILDSLIFCEHGSPIERVYVRGRMRWTREHDCLVTTDEYRHVARRFA